MGHSETGRHGDGREVYGADATWPPGVRARWPEVVREVLGGGRAVPGPPRALVPLRERPLRVVLQDPDAGRLLRAWARRTGWDEADLARVWAASGGHWRQAAWRVAVGLELERRVAQRIRLPAATRTLLRAQVVSALSALRPIVDAAPGLDWLATPEGQRLAATALARRGGGAAARVVTAR